MCDESSSMTTMEVGGNDGVTVRGWSMYTTLLYGVSVNAEDVSRSATSTCKYDHDICYTASCP